MGSFDETVYSWVVDAVVCGLGEACFYKVAHVFYIILPVLEREVHVAT